MSLATKITALLTSLSPGQLKAMPPAEAQVLSDQLRRVYRELTAGRIVSDAQEATTRGILDALKGGRES
jgi:hypothetical protein